MAVGGERQRFGVAKDFDGLARGVNDDAAVATTRQVLFKGLREPGLKFPVEVFRELSHDFIAVHAGFAFLKPASLM